MIRIGVICEGKTECNFVSQSLEPYCWNESGVVLVPVELSARNGRHRGGNVSVERLAEAVYCNRYSFDRVTTLVDYYGFRHVEGRSRTDLEADILQAVCRKNPEMNPKFVHPYVQMYEFEALLFSDVSVFEAVFWDRWSQEIKTALEAVKTAFPNPETINNGPETAPSKRLQRIIPRYDKLLDSSDIALLAGVDAMRQACPNFNDWVERLLHWD